MVQYKKEALTNNFCFFLNIKMSEKTLKFKDIIHNKKEFHKSKKPIDLFSVNVDQIDVSDKFKHEKMFLSILLVTKKVKLLNHYALFYLK